MNENKIENNQEFEPRIVAFVCNWCTYAGADLTGTSRLKYATNVEIVRFPCTGRIDFMLLLKAFAGGADGIIVSGCHPNDCHYTSGNFHARRLSLYSADCSTSWELMYVVSVIHGCRRQRGPSGLIW